MCGGEERVKTVDRKKQGGGGSDTIVLFLELGETGGKMSERTNIKTGRQSNKATARFLLTIRSFVSPTRPRTHSSSISGASGAAMPQTHPEGKLLS